MARTKAPNNIPVVLEYLKRFPGAGTKTIARKAYRENPKLWPTFDACYQCVRKQRGQQGEHNRRNLSDNGMRKAPGSVISFPRLPKPITRLEPWRAHQIDTPGDWLILSDVHVPFHDESAVKVALREGKSRKLAGIVLNGDIADFYRVSDHRKDCRTVDLWEEIEAVREFLGCLRDEFPRIPIVYKWGNHEERYENWFLVKAPELLDIPEFEFANLMQFDKFKITEVKDKRPIRLGKLWLLHGHEFRRGFVAPVNPARGLFLRTGDNCLQGDCHRSSHHQEMQPLTRHVISCFSTGCLCQLDVAYDPLNRWCHGFAVVKIAKDGAFDVSNYRIIGGKCYT